MGAIWVLAPFRECAIFLCRRNAAGPLGDNNRPSDIRAGGPRWWAALRGYFRALWSGTEPLHRVVVSDMLIGGTLINVTTLAISFVLFGLEVPKWIPTAIFVSPLPYNLFVVSVVWRTAARSQSALAWAARILAILWLGVMTLI